LGVGQQGMARLPVWSTERTIDQRYDLDMSRHPIDVPPGSVVVVTNPDEDCSAEAFHAFFDELLAAPEPELDGLDAAEALRELRVDAGA